MLIYVTHIHKVNCVFSLLKYGNPCVLGPDQRMKVVDNCANSLEIKNDIQPSRYFGSSLKIVRMADEYLDEGRLEKAYILYRRFMTCFKKLTIQILQVCHCQIEPSIIEVKRICTKNREAEDWPLEQYTLKYKQHCEEHQKLKEKRGLMLWDKEDKPKKDYKFKITPVSLPEEKGTTDNVKNLDVLETE